jgi:hypothetical protein
MKATMAELERRKFTAEEGVSSTRSLNLTHLTHRTISLC